MRWTWDPEKDRINRQKHGISFQTAQRVFRDPGVMIDEDPHPSEQRWRATGHIGHTLVTVIYTETGEESRIISARRASRGERRTYEEGI